MSVSESDIFDQANMCGKIDGEAEQLDNWIICSGQMRGQFAQLEMLRSADEDFHLQTYEVEFHGYYLSDGKALSCT